MDGWQSSTSCPRGFLSRFFPVRGVPASRGGHGVPPGIVVSEVQQAGFELITSWTSGLAASIALFFRNSNPNQPDGANDRQYPRATQCHDRFLRHLTTALTATNGFTR
jgi:hypothetical protein